MRAVSDSTKYDNSPLQVVWRVSPVRCTANFTTIDYNRHNGKIYFGVQTHFEGEGTRELTESERARRGRCGWKYRIGNGAVIDPSPIARFRSRGGGYWEKAGKKLRIH